MSFLIKLQCNFIEKRDSGTDVFLWILQHFLEHLFYRAPQGGCFYFLDFQIDIVYKALNTNSALYRKVGNITQGCQVQPKRNIMLRETDGKVFFM